MDQATAALIRALERRIEALEHLREIEVIPPLRKDEVKGASLVIGIDEIPGLDRVIKIVNGTPQNGCYDAVIEPRISQSWDDATPIWAEDLSASTSLPVNSRYSTNLARDGRLDSNGDAIALDEPVREPCGPYYVAIYAGYHNPLTTTTKWAKVPVTVDPTSPRAFDVDLVANVTIADGNQTIVAGSSPTDFSSKVVISITDGDTSITAGVVTIAGVDPTGLPIHEDINIANGGTTTYNSTNTYKTISVIAVSGLIGNDGTDKIQAWIKNYPFGVIRTYSGGTYVVNNTAGAENHLTPNSDADWTLIVLSNKGGYFSERSYSLGDYVQEIRDFYTFASNASPEWSRTQSGVLTGGSDAINQFGQFGIGVKYLTCGDSESGIFVSEIPPTDTGGLDGVWSIGFWGPTWAVPGAPHGGFQYHADGTGGGFVSTMAFVINDPTSSQSLGETGKGYYELNSQGRDAGYAVRVWDLVVGTVTTNTFIIPGVGLTVSIQVDSTTGMVADQKVSIMEGKTWKWINGHVQSVTDGTHFVFYCEEVQRHDGNIAFQEPVIAGALVSSFVLYRGCNTSILQTVAGSRYYGGLFIDHDATVNAIAWLEDQQTQGTDGGTFTSGADQTAAINTTVSDTASLISLSTNQFTPVSGTYRIVAWTSGFSCGVWRAWLYDATDATVILLGSSEDSNTTNGTTTHSLIDGEFTTDGTKAYEIRKRCGTTQAVNGYGVASNFAGVEVYTRIVLQKIA